LVLDWNISHIQGYVPMTTIAVLRDRAQLHFLWVLIGLLLAFGLQALFVFHRLFGPLFSLEKAVQNISKGDLKFDVRIRQNDDLKSLSDGLDEMVASIRRKVETDRSIATEVAQKIEDPSLKERLYRVGSGFKMESDASP
jgi:nitrogen fixation/metabolism regulation signal transduction histidine kinase